MVFIYEILKMIFLQDSLKNLNFFKKEKITNFKLSLNY